MQHIIVAFKCKETEKIWFGDRSLRFPYDIQQVSRRKLRMLNNAKQLHDLRVPPNNRLEELKGKSKGKFSIRINKQWRLCFNWSDGNAYNVAIEDYH